MVRRKVTDNEEDNMYRVKFKFNSTVPVVNREEVAL